MAKLSTKRGPQSPSPDPVPGPIGYTEAERDLALDRDAEKLYQQQVTRETGGRNPDRISLLGNLLQLVLAYPPRDIRFTPEWAERFPVEDCSDLFMQDIAYGMELRVIRKDVTEGVLEVAAYLPTNLDEIDRYNTVVDEHNAQWQAKGSKKELFEPRHGSVARVRDQYVNPVVLNSTTRPWSPEYESGASDGPLAKARPAIARKIAVTVVYRITKSSQSTRLEYYAKDYRNKVLYYNDLKSKFLDRLVLQSVQELWGHPYINDGGGELLEGVALLIQGRKLKICEEDNSVPPLLQESGLPLKTLEAYNALTTFENFLSWVSGVMLYLLPIALGVYILVFTLQMVVAGFGHSVGTMGRGVVDMSVPFVVGICAIMSAIWLNMRLGRYLDFKRQCVGMVKKVA